MKSENNDDNKNAESRVQASAGGARRTASRQKNAGSRTRQYRGGSKNRQDKPFRPTAKKTAAGGAVKNSRNTQKPAKTGGRPSGRKNSRRATQQHNSQNAYSHPQHNTLVSGQILHCQL